MNKLIFIYLLSLMIIYTQCTACTSIAGDEVACSSADGLQTGESCVDNTGGQTKCKIETDCEKKATDKCGEAKVPNKKKCVKDGEKCKIIDDSTNSSNMLNIFKITFALLIIFTIL